jgi:ABC-type sugar transport system permease subunit
MHLKKINWAPYLLILPSFIYLTAFFGWPMIRSLQLSVQRDSQILPLRAEPLEGAARVGLIERGTFMTVLDVIELRKRRSRGHSASPKSGSR